MWKDMAEEPKITSVGTKGQIVVSQKLRKELQIIQNTKLAVYRRDDKLVVAKLAIPPLGEELKDLFREIDEQNKGKKKPKEKRVRKEIKDYKVKKRARKVA
jgi:bifunctional DNA-binding transcriptional regulator/antitoxin component of YhaV-PrlF toxin-antitoxin module